MNINETCQEREIGDCHTVVNLQGKLNCKYVVGLYFSDKPQRINLKERWPATPEENLERLAEAGFPLDRQIPKCSNCGSKTRLPSSDSNSYFTANYLSSRDGSYHEELQGGTFCCRACGSQVC